MKHVLTYQIIAMPLVVAVCAVVGLWQGAPWYITAIALGSITLVRESVTRIFFQKDYSLDYLALATIAVSLATHQYATGAVIALMVTISDALERYGTQTAQKSLEGLVQQIPKTCTVIQEDGTPVTTNIENITPGHIILIKNSELVALDGILKSDQATINEANLTGEMLPVTYQPGYHIKSGVINAGTSFTMEVTGTFATSTYQHIITLAQESKKYPARFVHLSRSYNISFTIITFLAAGASWLLFRDSSQILAIFAIATPCPLLIAAPLSYLGGINRAAHSRIVVKRPTMLETIANTNVVLFDKTGTLTMGEPKLKNIIATNPLFRETQLVSYAASLELHSLHPLARAILNEQKTKGYRLVPAEHVKETAGLGVTGIIDGKQYTIKKSTQHSAAGIILDFFKDTTLIGQFIFEDTLKDDVDEVFHFFAQRRISCAILTGDTAENADRIFGKFDIPIYSECSPERKLSIVQRLQKEGNTVAVIGDGINDAPALKSADVGVVFSGAHNSAATEAADIALFSHNVAEIPLLWRIAGNSVKVAKQSVVGGIGMSCIGIALCFAGIISPVYAAIIQEFIDATVIGNSLRATY